MTYLIIKINFIEQILNLKNLTNEFSKKIFNARKYINIYVT